jgi:hypothetical protein
MGQHFRLVNLDKGEHVDPLVRGGTGTHGADK